MTQHTQKQKVLNEALSDTWPIRDITKQQVFQPAAGIPAHPPARPKCKHIRKHKKTESQTIQTVKIKHMTPKRFQYKPPWSGCAVNAFPPAWPLRNPSMTQNIQKSEAICNTWPIRNITKQGVFDGQHLTGHDLQQLGPARKHRRA